MPAHGCADAYPGAMAVQLRTAEYLDALEAFDTHLRVEKGASPHTRRAYRGDVVSLLAGLEAAAGGEEDGLPLGEVESGNLREWVLGLTRGGASPATVARRTAAVRRFFAFCHRTGRIPADPALRLRSPKKPRRLPRVLQQDQADAVLSTAAEAAGSTGRTRPDHTAPDRTAPDRLAAPTAPAEDRTALAGEPAVPAGEQTALTGDRTARACAQHGPACREPGAGEPAALRARAEALRDAAIVELLYATGVRVSELVGIDRADVDGTARLITVRGKGGKVRRVPFGLPAEKALAAWTEHGRPVFVTASSADALFLGVRGGRMDVRQVRRVVHRATAAVPGSPELSPHGMRHSAATHMVENGADIRQVQEYFCFYEMWSTEIYTHVSMGRLAEVYGRAHPRA